MSIKVTTLIENSCDPQKGYSSEHGLALYLEADGLKILFDTGQSGKFIENAAKLGIDLNGLDYIIISHGHYDHANGLKPLLQSIAARPTLVVGSEFFRKKCKLLEDGSCIYNGVDFEEAEIAAKMPLIKVSSDSYQLSERVKIHHHFDRTTDYEKLNEKYRYIEGNQTVQDDFADEIALAISIKKGVVVIVGCSHVGVVNILETIKIRDNCPIHGVIGGTHLVEANRQRIDRTIDAFKTMGLKMAAVSHCTGQQGQEAIRIQMPEQFIYNDTANVIELD